MDKIPMLETLSRFIDFRVLVGNKCDLQAERQVGIEDGKKLAEDWGCPFMECSAKEAVSWFFVC